MAKLYYSNKDLKNDLSEIARQINVSGWKPEVVIGPGRGAFVMGVMLSHYFEVPFHGFEWQTRDHEMIKESTRLETILSKYSMKNILLVDDINDSGSTLLGMDGVVKEWDKAENSNNLLLHESLKYATLFDKESSNFSNVEFTANRVKPDEEKWIVYPYEEWWK